MELKPLDKKYGIENTKEIISSLGEAIGSGIRIAKSPLGLGAARNGIAILGELKDIAVSIKPAIPELGELDGDEKTELLVACLDMLKNIGTKAIE